MLESHLLSWTQQEGKGERARERERGERRGGLTAGGARRRDAMSRRSGNPKKKKQRLFVVGRRTVDNEWDGLQHAAKATATQGRCQRIYVHTYK